MIRLVDVSKQYPQAGGDVTALDGVSLEVPAGEFLAVMGRSGSGKSTLLNLIAGIDRPTRGEVWVDGRNLAAMDEEALTLLRRRTIGLVFQFFNLLTPLDLRENVALPALLVGAQEKAALAEAERLLDAVGLGHRARSRPHALSGGEMQRAAIARALVHRPRVLLADEPTGNLDSRAAARVLDLMRDLSSASGATVLLVTHSHEAAAVADRIVEMRDGRLEPGAGQCDERGEPGTRAEHGWCTPGARQGKVAVVPRQRWRLTSRGAKRQARSAERREP